MASQENDVVTLVRVPDTLDRAEVERLLKSAAEEKRHKQETDDYINALLRDDTALATYEKHCDAPLVRASVYGSRSVYQAAQEVLPFSYWGDPRRPVRMRGSKASMIRIYGRSSAHCENGLCEAIADRYFRMLRWTSFDFEETAQKVDDTYSKLHKGRYVTHHFKLRRLHLERDGTCAWIRGERYHFHERIYCEYVERHLSELTSAEIDDIARAPSVSMLADEKQRGKKAAVLQEEAQRIFGRSKPLSPEAQAEYDARKERWAQEEISAKAWAQHIINDWIRRENAHKSKKIAPRVPRMARHSRVRR